MHSSWEHISLAEVMVAYDHIARWSCRVIYVKIIWELLLFNELLWWFMGEIDVFNGILKEICSFHCESFWNFPFEHNASLGEFFDEIIRNWILIVDFIGFIEQLTCRFV